MPAVTEAQMNKKNALTQILDYETGDSWNGTHGRNISVKAQDDRIEVISENAMHEREQRAVTFTFEEIIEQFEEARQARYFRDFCYAAAKSIARVRGVTDSRGETIDLIFPALPAEIDADIQAGTQQTLTVSRKLIRLKP
jgi:hypothetical protein